MVRTTLGIAMMALLAATAGCKMCSHPFDECGPVWDGPPGADCKNCNPQYRAGSVLYGSGAPRMAHVWQPQPEGAAPAGSSALVAPPKAVAVVPRPAPSRQFNDPNRQLNDPFDRPVAVKPPIESQGAPHLAPPLAAAEPPMKLPPGSVLAPPGTREGDTRILSVTDRRLDESEKPTSTGPQPKEPAPMRSAEAQSPEPASQSTAGETPGWKAVSRPASVPQPATIE